MTLDAKEWIERSAVDAGVLARWPDYRVTLLAADDIDVASLATGTEALFAEAHARARRIGADGADPHVTRWRDAYRDFGVKPRVARPSVDALLRRAASEGGLPRINTLVDLYNAISIIYGVPIGGEDLARYSGPARLILAVGDEPFHTTDHGEPVVEHPEPGEPVWADVDGVTCRRWNWRQTTRTAISPETRRVAFIVDSLDAPEHRCAMQAAAHLGELMPDLRARTIG